MPSTSKTANPQERWDAQSSPIHKEATHQMRWDAQSSPIHKEATHQMRWDAGSPSASKEANPLNKHQKLMLDQTIVLLW
jgi:hypothetical protein